MSRWARRSFNRAAVFGQRFSPVLGIAGACALSALACERSLEGAPCPCAAGFVCCSATQQCQRDLESCPAGTAALDPEPRDTPSSAGEQPSPEELPFPAESKAGESVRPIGVVPPAPPPTVPVPFDDGVLVATQHNDVLRSGANLAERLLDTSALVSGAFGKTGARAVRGGIYGQPLYVPKSSLPGAEQSLVVVATLQNHVYAFDAHDAARPPLWVARLERPISLEEPHGAVYVENVSEVGVLGTPVVSLEDEALFVVAATKAGESYRHVLHKLSLRTGQDVLSPVTIEAPGFDSEQQAQRSALLLSSGVLFVAFGAYLLDEWGQGWVFSYDASSLAARGRLEVTPSTTYGPIWMGGQGPVALDGHIYLTADNADSSYVPPPTRGSSVLKLVAGSSSISVVDSFLPSYVPELGWSELGSSGPVPIPGSSRLVAAGNRFVYVLDQASFGAAAPNDAQIVQKFRVTVPSSFCADENSACNRIFGSPVFWSSGAELFMYVWAQNDFLRAFRFDRATGKFDCGAAPAPDCAAAYTSETMDPDGFPGGSRSGLGALSVSADGERADSAIVWGTRRYSIDPRHDMSEAVLRAYAAADVSRELWSSKGLPDRDHLGPLSPHAAPTVSGGQVFVPTLSGLSGRTQLDGEVTLDGPALAAAGELLVLAWNSNKPEEGLKLAWSDNGREFTRRQPLLEYSVFAPALASDERNRLYVGWVGQGQELRVMALDAPDFGTRRALRESDGKGAARALSRTAGAAPALAFGEGTLFLARRSEALDEICVSRSVEPEVFGAEKCIAVVPSQQGPSLSYADGRLYLLVSDVDDRLRLLESPDRGDSFADVVLTSFRSQSRPALLEAPRAYDRDLYLLWSDLATPGTLKLVTAEAGGGASFINRMLLESITPPDRDEAVALSRFQDRVYAAWSSNGQLTVAQFSPGELTSFGRLTSAGVP